MTKTILCIILLCLPFLGIGQSESINHQKYWWLRKRLKETFLHVGDKPGESLPGERLSQDPATQAWILSFSDCTMNLGWYLAVLGTENFLLRMHGKSTIENEIELYYALKALERLDKVSNVLWSYGENMDIDDPENLWEDAQYDAVNEQWIPKHSVSTTPDGFFVREDIPPGFQSKLKGVDGVMGVSQYDIWTGTYHTKGYKDGEESQDQCVDLLMGLMFVNRFVDPYASQYGTNLKNFTKTLTDRMVHHFRDVNPQNLSSWVIRNPQRNNEPVKRGHNAAMFAYPISWIANNIVYNKYYDCLPFGWQAIPDIASPNFNNELSLIMSLPFRTLRKVPEYDYGTVNHHHINYHMFQCLGATSNTWRETIFANGVTYLNARSGYDEQRGWCIYPLMNYVLYPSKIKPSVNQIQGAINIHPCESSYNFYNTNDASHPYSWSTNWISTNRFLSSNLRYEGNPDAHCNSMWNGYYNGLDYMLLYNLYRIGFAGQYSDPGYESPNDYNLSLNFPFLGVIGNIPNPYRVYALYSIESNSLLNSVPANPNNTADVEFVAGTRIVLKPGFKVMQNANFLGRISQGGACDNMGMKSAEVQQDEGNGHNPALRINQWLDSLAATQILPPETENWENADSTIIETTAVEVAPNPFKEGFSVSSSEAFDRIQIIDTEGTTSYENKLPGLLKSTYVIPSTSTPGIYFLLLYNANRVVGAQTIIKQ